MQIGPLQVTLHRTVRVKDGRSPSNLPPSLGRMNAHKVSEYKDKCPADWDAEGVFVALHDTEALWLSFDTRGVPVAVLVGAGGINALTGEKLGTKLEAGNYLVAPPQPWLDGWKSGDGNVFQFVATPYKKGEGITVGEQLIGKESKSGAIGIAIFEAKDPKSLTPHAYPITGMAGSAWDETSYPVMSSYSAQASGGVKSLSLPVSSPKSILRSRARGASRGSEGKFSPEDAEIGIGKGGKIVQKIYPDPHGIGVWKEAPTAAVAVYLVNAAMFAEITGEKVPEPVSQESYGGTWYGLQDTKLGDVTGSSKFAGLQSAFVGDTDNVKAAAAGEGETAEVK